jgi:glutathione S-transferase
MDYSPNSASALTITLTEPTPLIQLALQLKQQTYVVSHEPRTALKEIPGPALIQNGTIVVGEQAILGWLDRRYPVPMLFPIHSDTYAKACTLANAFTSSPELAREIWEVKRKEPAAFLLGDLPTIADLCLHLALDAKTQERHANRLLNWY